MPDPVNMELSARLRSLPRQLLLAVLNGTAVLVIVASVLALVATAKINNLAQNVAATMTDAVLSRVDVEPGQVLANLQRVSADVQTLRSTLAEKTSEGRAPLGPAMERLNERLGALEANIEQFRNARSGLVDEASARLAQSLGDALQRFSRCKAGAAGR